MADANGFDLTTRMRDLEPDWRRLADEGDNVFATWEWQSCWWRHFGRARPLRLVTMRSSDGAALAILPLYRAARVPVPVVRFLGHGPSDQLGPVCAPADRKVAADGLGEVFANRLVDGDLLIADELPAGTPWGDTDGATELGRAPSPVAVLGRGEVPANPRLRAQIRRRERRLHEAGRVVYRCASEPDRLDADLSTFLALHDARWRGESRSFVNRELFHRDFAARALARGWLRLRFLEVNGEAVASLYNLSFGGAESNYQAGRDPRFGEFSVGMLLHAHAMRAAADEQCREYRFLRGNEGYKARFADADPGLASIAFARTDAARLLLRALGPVPELPRKWRRRVPAPYAWGTGSAPTWSRP